MPVATTKPFRSGNSQAVRLPKEMAYPDDAELTIVKSGEVITIMPRRPSIQEMCDELRRLPAPSEVEVRDPDFFPDRPNLFR